MSFGQVIVGPPGSGKTTYCWSMQKFTTFLGRKSIIINIDPANYDTIYHPSINITDLVSLEAVMENFDLGPNGGMIYCIDYLYKNLDWLEKRLKPFINQNYYILFDCPGQTELFTLHHSLKNVISSISKMMDSKLSIVNLIDSQLCTDASQFMSALIFSLSMMMNLELPHINVFSKMDLLQKGNDLVCEFDYFTEVKDLGFVIDAMTDNDIYANFKALAHQICEVVEEYGLIRFVPLTLHDGSSLMDLLKIIDKSNGYNYLPGSETSQEVLDDTCAKYHEVLDLVRDGKNEIANDVEVFEKEMQ